MSSSSKPERLLRLQDVMDRTGCKRAKLYQLVQQGEFPKPVKIGSCAHWPESAVAGWIAQKIAAAERVTGISREILDDAVAGGVAIRLADNAD